MRKVSAARLQMLSLALPALTGPALNAEEAEQAVGVTTRCGGITYPAAPAAPGTINCAVIALANRTGFTNAFRHTLTSLRCAGVALATALFTSGETASHYETAVPANGHQINRFDQTRRRRCVCRRGQVVIFSTPPPALRQVLCLPTAI